MQLLPLVGNNWHELSVQLQMWKFHEFWMSLKGVPHFQNHLSTTNARADESLNKKKIVRG